MAETTPIMFTNSAGDEDFTINAAGRENGAAEEELDGISAISVYARFAMGTWSTGASVTLFIQGSFADEAWFDMAAYEFTDADEAIAFNFSGQEPTEPTALTDGTMTAGTILQGVIPDRMRAVVDSAGAYTGGPTTVSVRGQPR